MLEDLVDKARQIFRFGKLGKEMSLEEITRELGRVHEVQVRELSQNEVIKPVVTTTQLRRLSQEERSGIERRYAAGVSVATFLEEGSEVTRHMARDLREPGSKVFLVKWSGSPKPFGIRVNGVTLCEIRNEEAFDTHNKSVGSCVRINEIHNPHTSREIILVCTSRTSAPG
jgi:hypothetical protein